MAPNNALARDSNKKGGGESEKSVLRAGAVESRGSGTRDDRETVLDDIDAFLRGEARASLRSEVRGFFTVWTFLTRLPGPTWVDHHPGHLMRGAAYFPLAGALIGGFASAWYDLCVDALGLSPSLAAAASTTASLWTTGCFHEDGLADAADGIGGGWTAEQILTIMTDTRLGTYGCAVLLLYVCAKLESTAASGASAWALPGRCAGGGPAIVASHCLARCAAPALLRAHDYVDDENGPKYAFYSFMFEAKRLVTRGRVLFAVTTSFAVAWALYGTERAVVLMGVVFTAVVASGRYAEYLLGGVVGDYLGASICATEVALLTTIVLVGDEDEPVTAARECLASAWRHVVHTSLEDLVAEVWEDEALFSLCKWVVVVLLTALWCSCVGHPPVFVRRTVQKNMKENKNDDNVNISLRTPENEGVVVTNDDKDDPFTDPSSSFAERYEAGRSYLDSLAKPAGSLGTLEDWAARLAALRRTSRPRADRVACLVFAGDHGVADAAENGGEACSAYPRFVTRKVIEAGCPGATALAAVNGVARLTVVDVGVAGGDEEGASTASSVRTRRVDGLVVEVRSSPRKLPRGTANLCRGPAMTREEVENCLAAGREEVDRVLGNENENEIDVLVLGEVGIGNTTSSAALLAALTGRDPETLCGGGAATERDGGDVAAATRRKAGLVRRALKENGRSDDASSRDPVEALRRYGGAEIAALVGAIASAAERDRPPAVLVDGLVVSTAAAVAASISPRTVVRAIFFATRSTEPGQAAALDVVAAAAAGTDDPPPAPPALDMGMRMGEATGALAAVPLLRSAVALTNDMATLDSVLRPPPC